MGLVTFSFFALVVVGTSNAVNLTDGLDGLATGCTITVALAYAVLAYVGGQRENFLLPADSILPIHWRTRR